MLARFEWRLRQSGAAISENRPKQSRQVFLVLGGVLLLCWLAYHYLLSPTWIQQLPAFFSELLALLESAAVLTAVLIATVVVFRAIRRKRLNAGLVTAEALYALSPGAFERYVAGLFRRKGFKVFIRGRSGDHGVDLELLHSDNRRAIVQCKRYRNPIGPDIVRELFGTMIHEGAHHAFLVTTAEVSPAARDWAANKPMTLIDGSMLVEIANSLNGSA